MKWRKFSLKKFLPKKRAHSNPFVWKPVKTACILILLGCNIVLLLLSGALKGYSWYLSNQTRKQLDSMLAQRGIMCGSSVYRTLADYPQAYTLRADSEMQKAFAQAMLSGRISTSADKGNTTVWIGENGTVSWAASGDIMAQVTLNSIPEPQNTQQAQKIIQNILKNAGIKVRNNQFTVSQEAGGNFTIEVTQELDTTELIGCGITAVIGSGNELEIIGKWCTGQMQPLTIRALSSYSSTQMIFTLMSQTEGISQIVSAQPVYVISDRSGGRFTAIPCWRFSTDNGGYILNILSGNAVLASDLTDEIKGTENEPAPDAGSGV